MGVALFFGIAILLSILNKRRQDRYKKAMRNSKTMVGFEVDFYQLAKQSKRRSKGVQLQMDKISKTKKRGG